ncbi:MAG: plasmid mobilization protein [Bacteroidales bacterium]
MNRTVQIKFRCTEIEKSQIENYAKSCEMNISSFCREQALKRKLPTMRSLNNEELEFFKMMKSFEINFKRISNFFKSHDPALHLEVLRLSQDMNLIIKEFFL